MQIGLFPLPDDIIANAGPVVYMGYFGIPPGAWGLGWYPTHNVYRHRIQLDDGKIIDNIIRTDVIFEDEAGGTFNMEWNLGIPESLLSARNAAMITCIIRHSWYFSPFNDDDSVPVTEYVSGDWPGTDWVAFWISQATEIQIAGIWIVLRSNHD